MMFANTLHPLFWHRHVTPKSADSISSYHQRSRASVEWVGTCTQFDSIFSRFYSRQFSPSPSFFPSLLISLIHHHNVPELTWKNNAWHTRGKRTEQEENDVIFNIGKDAGGLAADMSRKNDFHLNLKSSNFPFFICYAENWAPTKKKQHTQHKRQSQLHSYSLCCRLFVMRCGKIYRASESEPPKYFKLDTCE